MVCARLNRGGHGRVRPLPCVGFSPSPHSGLRCGRNGGFPESIRESAYLVRASVGLPVPSPAVLRGRCHAGAVKRDTSSIKHRDKARLFKRFTFFNRDIFDLFQPRVRNGSLQRAIGMDAPARQLTPKTPREGGGWSTWTVAGDKCGSLIKRVGRRTVCLIDLHLGPP